MRAEIAALCSFILIAGLLLVGRRGFGQSSREGLLEDRQQDLFLAGSAGYHTFRIPALYVTQAGTVLAFCEGRKNAQSDTGDIDLVLRRSLDGGKTWEDLQVVANDGGNTIGNPCPIEDRNTGRIWLPLTRNLGTDSEKEILAGTSQESRTVWMTYSDDQGASWAPIYDITESTKDPAWTWYATGPGIGIQLRNGRLLVPSDHAETETQMFRSHAVYSDDGGKTWKHGRPVGDLTNECQAVELLDGSVLMNMRSYHGMNRRYVSRSPDGGETWSDPVPDEALVESVCQASFIRLTGTPDGEKSRLLFSNPASKKRERMTLKLSYDEGKTWPVEKLVNAGPSAYSSLAVLPDYGIGCLYERGGKNPYEKITFARTDLEWLTDGADAMTAREQE